MIKKIALVAGCTMLAGCPANPPVDASMNPGVTPPPAVGPASCTQPTGPKPRIIIKYGDSSIEVTHKIKSKQNNYFELRLDPSNSSADPVDFTTMNVFLIGADAKSQWLSGTYNAGGANQKTFDICADAPEDMYKYTVVIPGVGMIDPRVEIKN